MTTTRWPLGSLVAATKALLEETALKNIPTTEVVSCTKGCAYCCHWPIAASPLEGLVLYDHIQKEHAWTSSLQNRLREHARRVTGLDYSIWRTANIPCPLLKLDSTCLAYDARPIMCRLNATTTEPKRCHVHDGTASTIPALQAIQEYRNRELDLLKSYGITKLNTFPVSTALLIADRIVEQGMNHLRDIVMNVYLWSTFK